MKSQLKYAVITEFICVSVLMLGSCERINQNQDNNESSAQSYGLLQTELATLMELVDEVSDQTTGKGIGVKSSTPYLTLKYVLVNSSQSHNTMPRPKTLSVAPICNSFS